MKKKVEEFAQQRLSVARISATSLIFTVFGDTVSVHGGTLSLGSLIELMKYFGINERLVRTSVYRLVQEGLLESFKQGRCSYYRFTDHGKIQAARASRRIYSAESGAVDARASWLLILIVDNEDADKVTNLKRSLSWLGYAQLKPSLLGHPSGEIEQVNELLANERAEDLAIVLRAEPGDAFSLNRLKELVYERWNLGEVSQHYDEFCDAYRAFLKPKAMSGWDARDFYLMRTIMIHEFRRILLRDPHLPDEMLPSNWPGFSAAEICRKLYLLIAHKAQPYIRENLESIDGKLPKAGSVFYQRFGGKAA